MEKEDSRSGTFNPLFKEKVHVAFLGWEIERIIEPVIQMLGNRLIIICMPKERERAWGYLEEIKKQLEEKGKKVDVIEAPLLNMVELLEILNKIFQVESSKGNEIFVNVSAGTKVSASASTIAAMSKPGITAYYAKPERYIPAEEFTYPKTISKGIKEIYALPECQVDIPEQKYIKTLRVIKNKAVNVPETGRVYLKDLIEDLEKLGIIHVKDNKNERKHTSSLYMAATSLVRNLNKWNYIDISPKRRNKFITMTEKGENAIRMYLDYEIDDQMLVKGKNKSIKDWMDDLQI
ncbi:MAG: DUF6293 family protein [Candidatus Hodarchaeota archaeon]